MPFARCPLYVCVGAVRERAVVDGGATADHRIVDGVHAAELASFVRSALTEPATLETVPARDGAPGSGARG